MVYEIVDKKCCKAGGRDYVPSRPLPVKLLWSDASDSSFALLFHIKEVGDLIGVQLGKKALS